MQSVKDWRYQIHKVDIKIIHSTKRQIQIHKYIDITNNKEHYDIDEKEDK